MANTPSGLRDAVRVIPGESHILALWDHSACRGWNLYERTQGKAKPFRWVAGAGCDSLAWDEATARGWALAQVPAAQV